VVAHRCRASAGRIPLTLKNSVAICLHFSTQALTLQGVGALYVRRGVSLRKSKRGRASGNASDAAGTELCLEYAFGAASRSLVKMHQHSAHLKTLRDRFEAGVKGSLRTSFQW